MSASTLTSGPLNLCEKCHAPLGGKSTSICKRCGWYAVAGTYVDIDRSWEAEPDDQPAAADGRIPRWAWMVIATSIAIILASGAARAFTPDGSSLRSTISGVQFLLGVLAFL